MSISEIYTVPDPTAVDNLCDGSSGYGDVNIEKGDIVIVTSPPHTLIAATNNPAGTWTDNSSLATADTFAGFARVSTPTDYVFQINGKGGYYVELNPDDLDDTQTGHKFVTQLQKDNLDSTHVSVNSTSASWDDAYTYANTNSATNNSDYIRNTYVNVSGDTITGDLEITQRITGDEAVFTSLTALSSFVDVIDIKVRELSGYDVIDGDLAVDGLTTTEQLLVNQSATFSSSLTADQDVRIVGDLTVDGNVFFKSDVEGNITIGDDQNDNVIFNADITSDIVPNESGFYDLGSTDKKWRDLYVDTANVTTSIFQDLTVDGVTTLSGKNTDGPGVIIKGTPTGIFDVNTPGFEDRDGDYMIPDVDVTGDVVLHGSLSADEAHIYSLTASNFKAEYQRLVVNDGDLEVHNGTFRQRGGNMLIEGDIGHIDDENTYIRFEQDRIKFVCHDLNMLQLNENFSGDDIIILGDQTYPVDIRVQNSNDQNTLYIDSTSGYIGIGTSTPETKLHVATGEVQMATGDNGGGLMIPAGTSDERIEKTGSIRWNTEKSRYEGYREDRDDWVSFHDYGDTDGNTRIDLDAQGYNNSDRIAMYTAGCSAMVIHPDQTVAFAGDIQFDNATVYNKNEMTGPLSATGEFLYIKVNGQNRAIRLWTTPEDHEETLLTIHGEHIINISEIDGECASITNTGIHSISADDVLFGSGSLTEEDE